MFGLPLDAAAMSLLFVATGIGLVAFVGVALFCELKKCNASVCCVEGEY